MEEEHIGKCLYCHNGCRFRSLLQIKPRINLYILYLSNINFALLQSTQLCDVIGENNRLATPPPKKKKNGLLAYIIFMRPRQVGFKLSKFDYIASRYRIIFSRGVELSLHMST